MLNPLICAMVNAEKQFFDSCSSFFQKFDGSNQKFFGLDRGFQKTPITTKTSQFNQKNFNIRFRRNLSSFQFYSF